MGGFLREVAARSGSAPGTGGARSSARLMSRPSRRSRAGPWTFCHASLPRIASAMARYSAAPRITIRSPGGRGAGGARAGVDLPVHSTSRSRLTSGGPKSRRAPLRSTSCAIATNVILRHPSGKVASGESRSTCAPTEGDSLMPTSLVIAGARLSSRVFGSVQSSRATRIMRSAFLGHVSIAFRKRIDSTSMACGNREGTTAIGAVRARMTR
jgi:hypothetical protein